jgi:hypothetical protein
MNEFEAGEQYMLYKIKKYLEGAKDNIQIAVRTLNFIQKEGGRHEGTLRVHRASKAVRKHKRVS